MFYQLTWNFNHSPLTVEKLSVQHKATKKEKEYCTIFEQRRMMQWKNIHIEEQVPMFTHPEGWFEFTRKSSYSSVWVTVRCAHLTLLCCRAQQHRHCCCSAEKWSEHNLTLRSLPHEAQNALHANFVSDSQMLELKGICLLCPVVNSASLQSVKHWVQGCCFYETWFW